MRSALSWLFQNLLRAKVVGPRPVAKGSGVFVLCRMHWRSASRWPGARMAGNAVANPEGGVVIAGQASMVATGNQLLVTTQNAVGTNHSAINWQSFSIPVGQ